MTSFTRTAAERAVVDWYARQGYHVHRAEASFRRIPTRGSCAACHRRFEKTFSVSHDLFGIFDGVSVARGRPRVWWQVTTVSHRDQLGPRGGTRPNFNNVSPRKRKIGAVASDFVPDSVLIFGANTVRRTDDRRLWRHYFQVWAWSEGLRDWRLLDVQLPVAQDKPGHFVVQDGPGMPAAGPQDVPQARGDAGTALDTAQG